MPNPKYCLFCPPFSMKGDVLKSRYDQVAFLLRPVSVSPVVLGEKYLLPYWPACKVTHGLSSAGLSSPLSSYSEEPCFVSSEVLLGLDDSSAFLA